jgi:pyruvate ferredoxin oxidoreductase delta subunit
LAERVAIVGSGGVGKTTVALALSEALGYLLVEAKEWPELHYLLNSLNSKRKLIRVVTGFYPVVEREKCIRCNLCAAVCPDRAMVRDWEGYPLAIEELCTSCGSCFAACPEGALKESRKVVARVYEMPGALQLEGRSLKALLKELEGPWVLDSNRPEYALFADVALVLYNDKRSFVEAVKIKEFLEKNGVSGILIENESAEEGPGKVPKGLPPKLDHVLPLLENF